MKGKEALLFVNKKKQKNFFNLDRAGGNARGPQEQTFFGYLRPDDVAAQPRSLNRAAQKASKKNRFLYLCVNGQKKLARPVWTKRLMPVQAGGPGQRSHCSPARP